jgi:hypothetical protein
MHRRLGIQILKLGIGNWSIPNLRSVRDTYMACNVVHITPCRRFPTLHASIPNRAYSGVQWVYGTGTQ